MPLEVSLYNVIKYFKFNLYICLPLTRSEVYLVYEIVLIKFKTFLFPLNLTLILVDFYRLPCCLYFVNSCAFKKIFSCL